MILSSEHLLFEFFVFFSMFFESKFLNCGRRLVPKHLTHQILAHHFDPTVFVNSAGSFNKLVVMNRIYIKGLEVLVLLLSFVAEGFETVDAYLLELDEFIFGEHRNLTVSSLTNERVLVTIRRHQDIIIADHCSWSCEHQIHFNLFLYS